MRRDRFRDRSFGVIRFAAHRSWLARLLVWGRCACIIVETEAYLVESDEACHTFSRPSARRFVERNKGGACYIYFNYGVHWMLNVLVKGGPRDGLILIRALEPERGINLMKAPTRGR